MQETDTHRIRILELRQLIHPLVREASRADCPADRKAELLARLEPLYRALFSIQEEYETD